MFYRNQPEAREVLEDCIILRKTVFVFLLKEQIHPEVEEVDQDTINQTDDAAVGARI